MAKDATLTRVRYVCTGGRFRTEIEVETSHRFLEKLGLYLTARYGVTTRPATYREMENGLITVTFVVSERLAVDGEALPIHISLSKETVTPPNVIELLFLKTTPWTLPSTSLRMVSNMPTGWFDSASPPSLRFYQVMNKERHSKVLTAIRCLYAQQPIPKLTPSVKTSTAKAASSALSPTEEPSLDSQPTEANNARLTTHWVYFCRGCYSTNIEIAAWVDPNNEFNVVEGEGPNDDCWCHDCLMNHAFGCQAARAETWEEAVAIATAMAVAHERDENEEQVETMG